MQSSLNEVYVELEREWSSACYSKHEAEFASPLGRKPHWKDLLAVDAGGTLDQHGRLREIKRLFGALERKLQLLNLLVSRIECEQQRKSNVLGHL